MNLQEAIAKNDTPALLAEAERLCAETTIGPWATNTGHLPRQLHEMRDLLIPYLIARVRELEEALQEIAKGEGAFSQDHLTHAINTIENMKSIAVAAIDAARQGEQR